MATLPPPQPPAATTAPPPAAPATIIVHSEGAFARWRNWALYSLLGMSVVANITMYSVYGEYYSAENPPTEKYHSGDKTATDKIAVIHVTGTIMPPFTSHTLKAIKRAKNDAKVKGVLLVVNSPGGFVADSHQIYHRLKELRETTNKPIYVAMDSLAASGGYYVAMGAGPEGKIFAEPTTWTGSIGVIIPHYDVTELSEKIGLKSTPLTTGQFKDTLSPFKKMTEEETAVWKNLMTQAYEQFIDVIADGRGKLKREQIREYADGRIFTAKDAKQFGLIDEIGYVEDAVEALKKTLNLTKVRVVQYERPVTVVDLLGLGKAEAGPREQWNALIDASVPRSMYFCSWGAPLSPVRD